MKWTLTHGAAFFAAALIGMASCKASPPASPAARATPAAADSKTSATSAPAIEIRARVGEDPHEQTFFALLPGGRIVQDLPTDGPDRLDFARLKARRPRDCGEYVISADAMTVTWGGGRPPDSWKLGKDKTGAEIVDGQPWLRGNPGKAGTRLDGRFLFKGAGGVKTTMLVYTTGELTLRPDGTYTLNRSASDPDAEVMKALGSNGQKGTYAWSGFTMTLRPTGGAPTRHTFFTEGQDKDPARPAMVVFDNAPMLREDH